MTLSRSLRLLFQSPVEKIPNLLSEEPAYRRIPPAYKMTPICTPVTVSVNAVQRYWIPYSTLLNSIIKSVGSRWVLPNAGILTNRVNKYKLNCQYITYNSSYERANRVTLAETLDFIVELESNYLSDDGRKVFDGMHIFTHNVCAPLRRLPPNEVRFTKYIFIVMPSVTHSDCHYQ